MNWHDFITADPQILFGKPVLKNTRISVDLILERLANGETIEQILESYPNLTRESIFACLQCAADNIRSEVSYSSVL